MTTPRWFPSAGTCSFAFCLLFCAQSLAAQTTRIVDDDGLGSIASCDDATAAFTSPAAAMAAASSGDTILVCPGTYMQTLTFGKEVTLRSVSGPAETILDGNGAGSVVTVLAYRGLLEGFTIRNGVGSTRGGQREGGGIMMLDSIAVIRGNIITGNRACQGGGIWIVGSGLIEGNTIANNRQAGCSGGGGGIGISGGTSAVIRENNITDNVAESGGGISLDHAGQPTIERNVIVGNTADSGGGIRAVRTFVATIAGNLIARNRAASGGGISWLGNGVRAVNNTIVANDGASGSGVFADDSAGAAVLANNIIVAASGQAALYCGSTGDLNPPVIRSNDLFSATGATYAGTCADQTGTNGNISSDPLFSSAAQDDYHLTSGSPAIDTGDGAVAHVPTVDLDGGARTLDGNLDGSAVVDMGADEAPGPGAGPGAFGKAAPANGAASDTTVVIGWTASAGATGYEYCVDTIDNGACDTSWVSAWTSTRAVVSGLAAATTHYWQVRANNSSGSAYADGATTAFWSFTTAAPTRVMNLSGDLDFGLVLAPGASVRTLVARNNGNSPLSVTGIAVPAGFSVTLPPSLSIAAGAIEPLDVYFLPSTPGSYSGSIVVSGNQTSGGNTIAVSGTGVGACNYVVTPSQVTVPSAMSSVSITATTIVTGCVLNVQTAFAWIRPGVPSGTRSGIVNVSILPNEEGRERVGTLLLGDATVTVTQQPLRLWWQHQSGGYLSAWDMSGATLAVPMSLTPPQITDMNWKIVGTGDFNGDGQPDLLWQNRALRLATVWLMNGTTFIGAGVLSPNTVSDPRWVIRAVADMDKDGKPDIIWQHETEGWVSVWLMDGLRLREGRGLSPNRVDPNWELVGAADRENGTTTLYWHNHAAGRVIVWKMTGTELAFGASVNATISAPPVTDPDWKLAVVADMTGDGQPDLIWHHQVTGALVVWFIDGWPAFAGATLLSPPQVSPLWRLAAAR